MSKPAISISEFDTRKENRSRLLQDMYFYITNKEREEVAEKLFQDVVDSVRPSLTPQEVAVVLNSLLKVPNAPSLASTHQWLARAAGKSDRRQQLNYIYKSEDEIWQATDGHRLHIFDANHNWTDNYKTGYYKPINKRCADKVFASDFDQKMRYPKFDDVFKAFNFVPRWSKSCLADLEITTTSPTSVGNKRTDSVRVGAHWYNLAYVRDALSHEACGARTMFWYAQDEDGILLINILQEQVSRHSELKLKAIVMPQRM